MLTLNRRRGKNGLGLPMAILVAVLLLNGTYAVAMLLLPIPKPTFDQTVKSKPIDTGKLSQITWLGSQQAAIGIIGQPVTITSYSDEKPLPIASVAKVITALAVLKQKPLELDQQGPTITLGAADVALYNSYKSKGGSVVKVAAGEEISQYQALQAMLIPSGNNIATSLVNWAFGSEAEYVSYANKMLGDLGLKYSHVDDASGFSPKTVSTASDLVLLGKEALKHPVIAQITSQSEATVPVAGKIVTTNSAMGKAGIMGVKTGHTAESGGCFLFAAEREGGGQTVTLVGVVLAAPDIEYARSTAPSVVEQGFSNVVLSTGLGESMVVGRMLVPWAEPVQVIAKKQLFQLAWSGSTLAMQVQVTPGPLGGKVGSGVLGADSTDIVLKTAIPEPDIWWRLTHPMDLIQAMQQ